MRNNTQDSADIRWEVLKSMLDDFPELQGLAKRYLLANGDSARISPTIRTGPEVGEITRKAVKEYRRERSTK